MKVWIDQDLCTGDGLCEEISRLPSSPCSTTASPTSRRATRSSPTRAEPRVWPRSPTTCSYAVVESAEECPGECIFIEAELTTRSGFTDTRQLPVSTELFAPRCAAPRTARTSASVSA